MPGVPGQKRQNYARLGHRQPQLRRDLHSVAKASTYLQWNSDPLALCLDLDGKELIRFYHGKGTSARASASSFRIARFRSV